MKLLPWLKSSENMPKYTAFVKAAGVRITSKNKALFNRAASGMSTHDELRAEYQRQAGLRRE